MAGRTFEELVTSGGLAPSTFGQPLRSRAQAEPDDNAPGMRQQTAAYEDAINAKNAADEAAKKKMIAAFGTDDPVLAAKIKATGAFDDDLEQRMRLDPEGTKASVDRAVALAGKGGVQDAGSIVDRPFSVGTGAHGERYYTNLSPAELKAEKHQADAIRGTTSEPPVTDLRQLRLGTSPNMGAAPNEQSPEEILFEGRLDKARQIAAVPEKLEAKQAKHASDVETYGQEILALGRAEDVTTARQKVSDDLVSGALLKRGVTPKEASAIDRILIKRAKTTLELAQPGVDRTFYMPWHKSSKRPGQAADLAEPATLLNPGGQTPTSTQVNQANLSATNDLVQHVNDTAGAELPRTFQYATPGKLTEGGPGETDEPRSDIGKFFSSLNQRRKRAQQESEERGYDPNAQSDIGKLFGF